MRKLRREPLSEHATRVLWKQTVKVVEAGRSAPSRSKLAKARKDEARRLWKQKAEGTFDEIRATLKAIASGVERCMYCESNEGTDIEHFWPQKRAPCRAFDWTNYLLACSACNSNHKRDRFPRRHGEPLLINPTEDDPLDHIVLTPTGKYVPLTDKGENSIPVFGLDRGPLERSRVIAWAAVDGLIVRYANACARDDFASALETQRALCEYPQVSVFAAILRVAAGMGAEEFLSPECRRALAAYPEIKNWLDG
ncbi:HNH endonuclease [Polyangium fumosum]|uniref:HNH endonuclease n=1 Tax=Polyangium fumosum TaxID=889272 RepID=A0A4U1JC91_9BACT|nr:HNH endonuclease [Polyangium fumosum]TKD07913.1 HNH endonuclease [Polyangium fumosum]